MADDADQPRPQRRRDAGTAAKPAAMRSLPHNIDLEKTILGTLLAADHATAIHIVRENAPHPMCFWHRDHQIIYLACLELDDQGHRVEGPAVAELLARWPFGRLMEKLRQTQLLVDEDRLDGLDRPHLRELLRRDAETADMADSALAALGGSSVIFDLAGMGSAAGLKRNAELLRDYHQKRRLIRKLSGVADRAYLTTDAFGRLADDANQAVLELTRTAGVHGVHSVQSVTDEALKAILDRNTNPDEGLKTGIGDIDKRLMSLRKGGLYILAARPGVGKTSLALKVVENICNKLETGGSVLFFSLEVDRVDLLKKMMSALSGVEFSKLDSGAMTSEEFERLQTSADRFKDWRLDLMDVTDLTVTGLRSVVKRRMLECAEAPLRLIVIDYLQLLNPSRSDMTEYEKVSEITRVLKVLAKNEGIPVLALSQMSRDSEKGAGSGAREPKLSDLRGSGSIEQDADAVLFIHRVEGEGDDSRRVIKVILAKNRFGPTGFAMLEFLPANMRFQAHAGEPPASEGHDPADRKQRMVATPGDDEDLFK
jgi:replicative DNA helicase